MSLMTPFRDLKARAVADFAQTNFETAATEESAVIGRERRFNVQMRPFRS